MGRCGEELAFAQGFQWPGDHAGRIPVLAPLGCLRHGRNPYATVLVADPRLAGRVQ